MFTFSGPAYLAFYLILSLIVLLVLYQFRLNAESGEAPRINLKDPYLIAYLRGGANETLRVAMVYLIDQQLLTVTGSRVGVAHANVFQEVKSPLENQIIKAFAPPAEAASIFKNKSLIAQCDNTYKTYLEKLDLLPGNKMKSIRGRNFAIAAGVLFLFGLGKIFYALSTGHSNVFFLFVLTAVAIVIAYKVSFPRLTTCGKNVLEDLRSLYRSSRSRPNRPAAEAMMLAAVFGLGALPTDNYAYTRQIFPQAYNTNSNSCGSSSCSSSCGSSSSDGGSSGGDGGSSCGGGGCGGCGGD